MKSKEEFIAIYKERAMKRSIEKFGYNIFGIDLDKLEAEINETREVYFR